VWKAPDEKLESRVTKGTVKHDMKINVWGCFAAHGVGKLRRIYGNMNKEMYLNILEDSMVPSYNRLFHGDYLIFQQGNDPKHTSKVVKDWFEVNNIQKLEWPSQSPDLNPIENLWSLLDRKTRCRNPNEGELFHIPELLDDLVSSMPRRVQAVIDDKGGATKY